MNRNSWKSNKINGTFIKDRKYFLQQIKKPSDDCSQYLVVECKDIYYLTELQFSLTLCETFQTIYSKMKFKENFPVKC